MYLVRDIKGFGFDKQTGFWINKILLNHNGRLTQMTERALVIALQ